MPETREEVLGGRVGLACLHGNQSNFQPWVNEPYPSFRGQDRQGFKRFHKHDACHGPAALMASTRPDSAGSTEEYNDE